MFMHDKKKQQIRLTDPWAIAPTTTTIGSSFGMISFHFTSLSEWKEVPRNQANILRQGHVTKYRTI